MIVYLIDNVDEDEVRGIIKQIDRFDTGEIDYQGTADRVSVSCTSALCSSLFETRRLSLKDANNIVDRFFRSATQSALYNV